MIISPYKTKQLGRLFLGFLLAFFFNATQAQSMCGKVRIGEVPRHGVVAGNVIVKTLLEALGYEVSIVKRKSEFGILQAIKNDEIDVFFGLNLPISDDEVRLYSHFGYLRTIAKNLDSHRIGLAVNDAGKERIKDLSQVTLDLPNTNPNIYVSDTDTGAIIKLRAMMSRNQFGTGSFRLVSLSPNVFAQGVAEKSKDGQITFFLIRQPSLLGQNLHMLTDYEQVLGEKNGQNGQYTITRKGYLRTCKNIGTLLKNFRFNQTHLSEIEASIASRKNSSSLVKALLASDLASLKKMLLTIKTYAGQDAFGEAKRYLTSD